jgi:hypothetical protein
MLVQTSPDFSDSKNKFSKVYWKLKGTWRPMHTLIAMLIAVLEFRHEWKSHSIVLHVVRLSQFTWIIVVPLYIYIILL